MNKEIKHIEKQIEENKKKIQALQRKNSGLNKRKTELVKKELLSIIKVGDTYTYKENLDYRSDKLNWHPTRLEEGKEFTITKITKRFVTFEWKQQSQTYIIGIVGGGSIPGLNSPSIETTHGTKLGFKNFCDYVYNFTDEGKKILNRGMILKELLNSES